MNTRVFTRKSPHISEENMFLLTYRYSQLSYKPKCKQNGKYPKISQIYQAFLGESYCFYARNGRSNCYSNRPGYHRPLGRLRELYRNLLCIIRFDKIHVWQWDAALSKVCSWVALMGFRNDITVSRGVILSSRHCRLSLSSLMERMDDTCYSSHRIYIHGRIRCS